MDEAVTPASARRGHRRGPRLAIAAIVAAAALALTSCQAQASTPAASADAKVTLNWWGYGPSISIVKQYIAAFNKQYPNITVHFKYIDQSDYQAALRPALNSNTGPDLFLESPGGLGFSQFYQYGTDLTGQFEKALGSDWKSKIAPGGIADFTHDGKLLAAPMGQDVAGFLWVNKDLFDKYHLTPPKTMDEWAKVCAQFKADGVGCFVQGAQMEPFNQDTYQSIANSIEPGVYYKAVEGKAKWTDPALVKALTVWKTMFGDGIMQPGAIGLQQYPDADQQFMGGKYAMVQMGTWYMANTRLDTATTTMKTDGWSGKPFTIEPIPFPTVAGGGAGELFGDSGGGLAVNVKSQHKQAATTFAMWIAATKKGQQTIANLLNNTPSLKGTVPDFSAITLVNPSVQEPALKTVLTKAEAVSEPRQLVNQSLATALGTELTNVALGNATPEQAAATMQSAAAALK
jgi:raffinose/stachyose/melibiose transport system substrate-binding protein